MSLSGKTLGNYQIIEVLGTGGMATVYRARQTNIEREVAIKVMADVFARQADFVERFKREAALFAKLEHPHILPIYDYGEIKGHLFLVLRLMEGGSLEDHTRREKLSLEDVARIMTQVCSALDHAHAKDVLHRDLKPNNILLDRFKNAYLMDFGIAKIMSSAGGSQMTATGTLLGTPAYMAPEMWKMAPVDGRADIYSLGLMLYEILTGELPYYGETPFQYMYAHLHEEVPRISSRFKGFSPDIDTVILRATAKEPSGRYATASEMANAFNEAIRNTKSDTPVQGGRRDPSNKLGKIFVVLEHSQSGLKAVPNLDDFIKKGDKGKAGQPMRVHSDRMDRILGELEKMDMADTAKTDQLRSILSQGKMNEAFLGVNVQPLQLPPSLVESTGQNNALLVIGVDEPSPAQAAGIFIGDILMKIEGVPVRGHDDLKNILKTLMPNQSAEVDIVRTGQLHKLTVQLVPKIT